MEHQTGPDGPDGTEEAEQAAATRPGAPEYVLGPLEAGQAAATRPGAPEYVLGPLEAGQAAAAQPSGPERAAEPGPATGEPRVDAALRLLDRLPNLPVSEHAELYEHVHGQLSDVLGELDSGSAGSAGD
jgi:hypothetical protein